MVTIALHPRNNTIEQGKTENENEDCFYWFRCFCFWSSYFIITVDAYNALSHKQNTPDAWEMQEKINLFIYVAKAF